MSTPESVEGWRIEGPESVELKNGWMHMFLSKEKMRHVYWVPEKYSRPIHC